MLKMLLPSLLSILAAVVPALHAEINATCYMQPDPESAQPITGVVTFYQHCPDSDISIQVNLTGFSPILQNQSNSVHGFDIHEYGDISGGCNTTGGHYNPLGVNHGAPNDTVRHAGDFGNKPRTPDGRMEVTFTDKVATLYGDHSILGRAVVVHEGVDDLGKGGTPESLAYGNSGNPIACCVIGISN